MPAGPLTKALTDNVRREMGVRGWSQSDLAEACEITQPAVSSLLRGKNNGRLDTVEKIAKGLGVPPTSLLAPAVVEAG